jgi:hypothetical protein
MPLHWAQVAEPLRQRPCKITSPVDSRGNNMAEFVVIERQNPMLGLTHGVYRKGEPAGMPICLCYDETQARFVAAALAAYAPGGVAEPARLPEPMAWPDVQASKPKAKKAPTKKSALKRRGRPRA